MGDMMNTVLNTSHAEIASGKVANFKTNVATNLKNLVVKFDYKLNGWTGLPIKHCGVNLLQCDTFIDGQGNEIQFTGLRNSDGEITGVNIVGTMNQTNTFRNINYVDKEFRVFEGQISVYGYSPNANVMAVGNAGSFKNTRDHYPIDEDAGAASYWQDYNIDDQTYNTPHTAQNTSTWYRIQVYPNVVGAQIDTVLYPMVCHTNDKGCAFEPYHGESISVSFPTTIYGGYVDLITGELVSEYGQDGSKLSDPVQYQLSPTTINTYKGVNNFYSTELGTTLTATYWVSGFDAPYANKLLKSFNVSLSPIQSGSGDASASNVRPISGCDHLAIERNNGDIINVTFPVLRKNLYNKNTDTIDYYLNSDGEMVYIPPEGGGAIHWWSVSDYISVQPNKNITISGVANVGSSPRYAWYDKNKTLLSTFKGTVGTTTTTVPNNAYYLRMSVYRRDGGDAIVIQVEYGDTVTYYEPYNESNSTLYGGYIDVVKGEITVTDICVEFDGTESGWSKDSTDRFRYKIGGVVSEATRSTLLCNRGTFKASGGGEGATFIYNSNIYYYPPQTVTTVDEFLAWLQDNPLQCVYSLATLQKYSFDPVVIKTLLGYNTFDIDTGDLIDVSFENGIINNTMLNTRSRIMLSTPHIETNTTGSFTTNFRAPIKECKVDFSYTQDGSGIPSPNNIRHINGRDYQIMNVNGVGMLSQFGMTVYSGTFDIISGRLTSTWLDLPMDKVTYSQSAANFDQLIFVPSDYIKPFVNKVISDMFSDQNASGTLGRMSWYMERVFFNIPPGQLVSNDNAGAQAWYNQYKPQFVFELKTPAVAGITPRPIKAINGQNTITANSVDSILIKYWKY